MLTLTRKSGPASLLAAAALFLPAAASAAQGPPPASAPQSIVAGAHADVIAPFLDRAAGKPTLVLESRADIDGQTAKRLDPGASVFHVEDDVKTKTPGTPYDFLGAAGRDIWVAPETRQGSELWPGFSTEGVPAGTLDGNALDLTLESVSGPGAFHLYTTDPFGTPKQLLTVGGTPWRLSAGQHAHANWAFSAAGRYALTFRAQAKIDGATVSDTADFAFHVSDLPPAATTTTTLIADPTSATLGQNVTLTAKVAPASAEGYVEFLDGATSLGHDTVSGGQAQLSTTALSLGSRSITARFTEKTQGTATTSTSDSQKVAVTADPGGDTFEIRDIADSYAGGDTLTARVAGWTLAERQSYRWTIRKSEPDTAYVITDAPDGTAATGTLVRELTTAYDGYEIQATLRGPGPTGSITTLQRTPWAQLRVVGPDRGSGQGVTVTGLPDGPLYSGDPLQLTAAAKLTQGQTLTWIQRPARLQTEWSDADPEEIRPEGDASIRLPTHYNLEREWAAQIRRADGTIAGQSAPVRVNIAPRELQLEGLRGLYRAGDTLRANASLYPALDGAKYRWAIDWEPIPGADGTSLELPVTASLDGKTLSLEVYTDRGFEEWYSTAAYTSHRLAVTDAPPGTQVIAFDALAGHYHQGGTIALRLNADPAATETDTVHWEWKRRGDQTYLPIPGAFGFKHDLRAEQGLDDTAIRATLRSADGKELATTAPVGIDIDDHGASPQQKISVTGKLDGHRAGDDVKLTASVDPGTVLDRYRWTIQRPGETEPKTIEGQAGPTLTHKAALADDGAEVRVAVTHADGSTAYGPSAPVTLQIAEAPATDPPAEEPKPTTPSGNEPPPVHGERPTAPEPPPGQQPTAPNPGHQGPAPLASNLAEPQSAALTRVAARKRVPNGKGSVVVAHLICAPGASCSVKLPRAVRVTVAGKPHILRLKTSKTRDGQRTRIQVVLTRAVAQRLKGRSAKVRFTAATTTGGRTTNSTITITIVG